MAALSFLDDMKDKASRLIPTPFTELVEQATSELLLSPDWEHIFLLCEHANAKEEHVTDLIRAVRRRIDNKSPKVQYFTVLLVEALVKRCGLPVHIEIAETKGLLRDIVQIATRDPQRDGEREAKRAALTFIANAELWFSEHPSERVRPLATLADLARAAGETFEGISPDTDVQINREVRPSQPPPPRGAPRSRSAATRQRRADVVARNAGAPSGGEYPAARHPPHQQQVVSAIPVESPTPESIGQMMDAVMLLVEYLNNSEANGVDVLADEALADIAAQVRKDHAKLLQLLSSGAQLENIELLLDVNDSQCAVIDRVARLQNQARASQPDYAGHATAPSHPATAPQQPQQQQHQHQPQHVQAVQQGSVITPARNESGVCQATVLAPNFDAFFAPTPERPPQQQHQQLQQQPPEAHASVPTIDELFGALIVPPPAPAPPLTAAPAATEQQQATAPPTVAAPEAAAPPPAATARMVEPLPEPRAEAPPVMPFPRPEQQLDPEKVRAEEKLSPPPAEVSLHGSVNGGDEDFDAFLNGRLQPK